MSNLYTVSQLTTNKHAQIAMKKYISITHEHTGAIASYIKSEYWGDNNKKLYYYIDYTFRARYYDKKINIYTFNNGNGPVIGLYSLNLFKKNDINNQEVLYLVFQPNTDANKYQDWCVYQGMRNIFLK